MKQCRGWRFKEGSGNDFADMVGAAREHRRSRTSVIRAGNTRHVDLGWIEAFDGQQHLQRYFDNNLGIGFEAQVTVESCKIKRLRDLPNLSVGDAACPAGL